MILELKKNYSKIKDNSVLDRYLPYNKLVESLEKHFDLNKRVLGLSEKGLDIIGIEIGTGPIKVLVWSQMHGNESTSTKAVLDLINYFDFDNSFFSNLRLLIIPMLNPDGSNVYTRENASGVDLNRDFQNLSQSESQVLVNTFEDFKPDYCFNLHDQRTIFNLGDKPNTATISFLSPAQDEEKTNTLNRKISMEIIYDVSKSLNLLINNKIGRFSDDFNLNCAGDYFQSKGVPTILFESGHYHGDYKREITREIVFYAIVLSLKIISNNNISGDRYNNYFEIPLNNKLFFDVIIRNMIIDNEIKDVSFQYLEKLDLINQKILFYPQVSQIGDLDNYFGHYEAVYNGKNIPFTKVKEWGEDSLKLHDLY